MSTRTSNSFAPGSLHVMVEKGGVRTEDSPAASQAVLTVLEEGEEGALPGAEGQQVLDLHEAAGLLMVSKKYLLELIAGGFIGCVLKNGEKAVSRTELQRLQLKRRAEQEEIMRELDGMIED